MTSQSNDVVYEFEAGRHTYRASLSRFRGDVYVDLREWYEPSAGEELRPTKKGISVRAEYLEELQEAIAALATAISSRTPARATS